MVIEKGQVPLLANIEDIDVWKTKQKFIELFGKTPVFLENLEVKNHIRNSIAHARTEYDYKKNVVKFVDMYKGVITYDSGYMQFEEFIIKLGELEDSVTAFSHIFMLLRIYDYILAPSEFI